MKRKKLQPISKLKRILWSLCREITAKRYSDVCFTCGRKVEGSNRQLGHCIPSSIGGALLRYHLDNLRWQCYNCNINCGGNGALYALNLTKEIGVKRIGEMVLLKRKITKADRYFYETKIAEYTEILASLQ